MIIGDDDDDDDDDDDGLKLPDICLTGEEKPRKNLTEETCPDRGSNPGPLCDRRACYRLSHSGGQDVNRTSYHTKFELFGREGECGALNL